MNQKAIDAINDWIATDLPLPIREGMSPALIEALLNRLDPPPKVKEPEKIPEKAKEPEKKVEEPKKAEEPKTVEKPKPPAKPRWSFKKQKPIVKKSKPRSHK